jgi:hypothetical protein
VTQGKLRYAFRDFLASLRRFWLEMMGLLFLAFTVLFILTAVQEYRRYAGSPEYGIGSFVLAVFFSGLMLLFALQSFWKARKNR